MNEFKKGYQPIINIVRNKNSNLVAISQNILKNWTNFFNHMLNVQVVHEVRQMGIHTAEPLVPEPRLVEVEIATGRLKISKSPGTD
jgi:hypothetical protein